MVACQSVEVTNQRNQKWVADPGVKNQLSISLLLEILVIYNFQGLKAILTSKSKNQIFKFISEILFPKHFLFSKSNFLLYPRDKSGNSCVDAGKVRSSTLEAFEIQILLSIVMHLNLSYRKKQLRLGDNKMCHQMQSLQEPTLHQSHPEISFLLKAKRKPSKLLPDNCLYRLETETD